MKREAQRLERTAREVAFGRPKRTDIRIAVRDLTLSALQSRDLTVQHLTNVANAIRAGIEPENPRDMDKATYRQALEGLCDAVISALGALDLESREHDH